MTTIRTVMLFSVVLAVLGSCAGTPQGTTTPLHTAAEEGDIDEVMELIAGKSKVNARDEMGRTALHRAAIAGDIFVTAALLNVGADPNLVDVDGRSVLHFAVLTCDTDLVAMLLGADANPDVRDEDDRSPLDLAMEGDCPEVVDTIRSAARLPDQNL
jgi:ankyrin repeat protein